MGYSTWDEMRAGEEEARRFAEAERERRIEAASASNAVLVEQLRRELHDELVAEVENVARLSGVTVEELLDSDGQVQIFGRDVFRSRIRSALEEGSHARR